MLTESLFHGFMPKVSPRFVAFETKIPTYEAWHKAHMESFRIVAIAEENILGWAALSPVSGRCVYSGVTEIIVYVGNNGQGKGVGQF